MEMVINISVIEESKYKQLWSRPETTQILPSSSYTKSYHPMLQLISLKKKKKKRGPHVLSVSTHMITSTHMIW